MRATRVTPPSDADGAEVEEVAGPASAARPEPEPRAAGGEPGWSQIAEFFEREAGECGGADAAPLLLEAARIREERLGDLAGALDDARRAVAADPGGLGGLQATRRLAAEAGALGLVAELAAAEATRTSAPAGRASLWLGRARALAAIGDRTGADAALAMAVEAAPGGFAAEEERAARAIEEGDHGALAASWRRAAGAVGAGPIAGAFLAAAAALLEDRLGDADGAADAALAALGAAPGDPVARATARRLAEALGRTEALARVLEEEAATGGRPTAWLELARLRAGRLGDPGGAVSAIERGLEQAPGEPLLLAELAALRESREEWREASGALRALAGALGQRSSSAEACAAWLHRAELEEERLGDPAEAIASCRAALAIDRLHRRALALLGRLCAGAGDWEGLLEAFEGEARAATHPRERAQRLFKAAEVLEERLEEPARAGVLYREALALDPGLLAARSALQRLHEREGDWAALLGIVETDLAELEADPAGAAARRRLALAQRRAELLDDHLADEGAARLAWEAVRRLDPANLPALRALGRLCARAGDWEAVAALHRGEADASPDERSATERLVRAAEIEDRRLGRIDRAIATYREALTLAPDHLPALAALARLLRRGGEPEALVEVLHAEASARGAPDERAALLAEAGIASEERLGDLDRAIECHEAALRAAPTHDPSARALVRLLARQDRWRELELLRREAVARSPEDPAALFALARLLIDRRGDAGGARQAIEGAAAGTHPAAVLLALRTCRGAPLARSAHRAALAAGASAPVGAALLAAAADDLPAGAARDELVARAEALAPGDPWLAPQIDRLAALGPPGVAARRALARRDASAGPADRARWAVIAAEAADRSGDAPAAEGVLAEALEEAPGSLVALRAARSLAARRGDLAAAGDSWRAEAGLLRDRALAAAALVEAGDLAARLGRPEQAVRDYRRAMELAPQEPVARARLEALARDEEPRESPAEAADRYTALGRRDAARGDGDAAAIQVARALDLLPDHAGALRLRLDLERARGEPRSLAGALEAAVAAAADPSWRAELRVEAARLHAGVLGQRAVAVELLRAAVEDDPGREEARALLAEIAEERAPDVAIEAHRQLLERHPRSPASWAALYRIFERRRAFDGAYVAASVLRWLGLPPSGAEALLQEGWARPLTDPPPLSPADWAALRHPDAGGPVAAMLELGGAALAEALRRDAPIGGVPERANHPLRALLRNLTRAVGGGPWELYPGPPGRLTVEPGALPAVLAGPDLPDLATPRELRFLLGRVAAALRTGSAFLGSGPMVEVAAALEALRSFAAGEDGAVAPELTRRLRRALPRRRRRELAATAAQAGTPPLLEAFYRGAAATADRTGLVLCGDVATALDLLRRGPDRWGGDRGAAGERADAAIDALLAFAASEAHLELRQRLRTAIA